jgi:hypothetical protein
MKLKNYLLTFCILFLSVSLFSQQREKRDMRGPDPDKVKAYKIAYITDILDLSSEEAQRFWPVYNKHEKMMTELRKQENIIMRKFIKSKEDFESISETDAKEVVTSIRKIRAKMDHHSQQLFDKMKKILPYKKILKLQVAERRFKKTLLERLRKRRKKYKDK